MIPARKAADMTPEELARYIDQSVLKPEFTDDDIRKYTQEVIDFGCKTICINPASLPIVAPMVEGTNTGLCVVADFPFGLATTEAKEMLTEHYCSKWDIEDLDIVANYGWLRTGRLDDVVKDLEPVVAAAHKWNTKVKVIIETDSLNLDQVAEGTKAAIRAGADFIKTSTGFFTGAENKGATVEVVKTMIEAADGKIAVKGAGCIRTREHFLELIDLGIDRMGIGYRSTPVVLGINPPADK